MVSHSNSLFALTVLLLVFSMNQKPLNTIATFFKKLWLNIHQLDSNKQGVCDNDSNAEMLGDFNQAF